MFLFLLMLRRRSLIFLFIAVDVFVVRMSDGEIDLSGSYSCWFEKVTIALSLTLCYTVTFDVYFYLFSFVSYDFTKR